MTPTPEQQRHQAQTTIQSEPTPGVAALRFTPVDDYTTFRAEYTFKENDIIVQFFLPVEVLEAKARQLVSLTAADLHNRERQHQLGLQAWINLSPTEQEPWLQTVRDSWSKQLVDNDPKIRQYWSELFPTSLERTAKAVFLLGPPRLQASYIGELSSWWFKAVGFVVLKPDDLVHSLLLRLDQDLDAAGAGAMLAANAR